MNEHSVKEPEIRKLICEQRDSGYDNVTQNEEVIKQTGTTHQDKEMEDAALNAVRTCAKIAIRLSKLL